ncbi:MAG: hypothetical protein CMN85_09255 [Spongiibacteraceae bacterium]|nr:hypothetical protein [Spongiibacteraceae bacterium]
MRYVVSNRHIEIPENYSLVVVESERISDTAELYASFPNSEVAIEDPGIARKLGIYVYRSGRFARTDTSDFYADQPEWLKQKHKNHVVKSCGVQRNIERISVSSLDEIDLEKLTARGGHYLVKAPTGARKSTLIAAPAFTDAIHSGRRAALVAPIVSICMGFHARAEYATGKSIAYYRDMQPGDEQNPGVVTTINSSTKKYVQSAVQGCDTLIVEEGHKVIDTIAESKDLAGDRRRIWCQTQKLLKSVRTSFWLDADINDSDVDFFLDCGIRPILIEVESDYSDITVELMSFGEQVTRIKAAISAGEKICIPLDNKAKAMQLAEMLSDFEGVTLMHAQNKDLPKNKQILESPNSSLGGVYCLIYTPVMGSSVSIEVDHFDRCFPIFTGALTPMSGIQLMRRLRAILHFEASVEAPPYIGWLERGSDFECDHDGINAIREMNRYLRESIKTSLPITLEHLGFNLILTEENSEASALGFGDFSAAARACKEKYIQSCIDAPEISIFEARSRARRGDLTPSMEAERDARYIAELCGRDGESGALSREAVEFYMKNGRRAVELHKIMLMSDSECFAADSHDTADHDSDKAHYEITKKLLTNFVAMLGFQYTEDQAISALSYLRKRATWNKLGICHLNKKGAMSGAVALRKSAEIMRALGYKTRARGGAVSVTGCEIVDRYVFRHTGQPGALTRLELRREPVR